MVLNLFLLWVLSIALVTVIYWIFWDCLISEVTEAESSKNVRADLLIRERKIWRICRIWLRAYSGVRWHRGADCYFKLRPVSTRRDNIEMCLIAYQETRTMRKIHPRDWLSNLNTEWWLSCRTNPHHLHFYQFPMGARTRISSKRADRLVSSTKVIYSVITKSKLNRKYYKSPCFL